MGLFSFIKSELIDIIEWLDPTQNTMVFRFERHDNEIKNGAKLVVRESQAAVFINEGQLADVFGPGTYTLQTQNMPLLSTLKGWKYGFDSPFKAEVYFVNTKRFTNMKWGTPNVFYIRDQDFGRVSLRAFGTYTMKIADPAKFIREVSGTDGDFTVESINGELRSLVVTRFIDALGESKLSLLDFAQNYKDLSDFCQKQLGQEFLEYGIEITKFLVSSISLPEELQAKLDQGTGMNMLGDMNRYAQMKGADAMSDAAKNPGGGGGGGMEGMMGMMMMQQMMNQQKSAPAAQPGGGGGMASPPPPPPSVQYYVSVNGQQQGPFNIAALQQMFQQGQMNPQTFVWKQGMAGWQAAGEVAELAGVFQQMAPPPPPPPPMP